MDGRRRKSEITEETGPMGFHAFLSSSIDSLSLCLALASEARANRAGRVVLAEHRCSAVQRLHERLYQRIHDRLLHEEAKRSTHTSETDHHTQPATVIPVQSVDMLRERSVSLPAQ